MTAPDAIAAQAVKLLVFAGSARTGSHNAKLAGLAAQAARDLGAQVTELDLLRLGLPLYEARIEAAGVPEGANALRDQLAAHDAVIVASPEYNGFPTPLLINALDWVSRVPASDGRPAGLATMAGKPAAVMSASPGALGGIRSLGFTRQFLHNSLGFLVLPEQMALPLAAQAFDPQGQLLDAKQQQALQRVVRAVLRLAGALKAQ
jgi:chromate reductase, NAD(P)H dehydrogenase (quinone)